MQNGRGKIRNVYSLGIIFLIGEVYNCVHNPLTKTSGIIFAIFMFFMVSCGTKHKNSDEGQVIRPNVIFIAVDDLNDWLGCMGGHPNAKTPNLDRLASEGVLFTNAHCQAPLCGPSRASLMSGLRPPTTGIYGMIDDDKIRSENPATDRIIFLPEYFRNNRYHTIDIGK